MILVDIKQIECGLALSALLSTRIFVIIVVKMFWTPQQILTTVMTNIAVDKSAANAKPHSIFFFTTIST